MAYRGENLGTNVVLIDLENVQPSNLGAMADGNYRVLIFVGATQAKLGFELVAAAQKFGERLEYIKMSSTGPNSLDFHIAFYLGRLAADNLASRLHVISKDTGFDPLIKHAKSLGLRIFRWSSIDEIPALKKKIDKANCVVIEPAVTTKKSEQTARDVVARFIDMLRQPKSTKPRTVKTLESALQAFCQKSLSQAALSSVLQSMRDRGIIAIADGKVTYPGLLATSLK